MSALWPVSQRLGPPARVPPPPDPRDAPAAPEIGTARLSRCVLATGPPTRPAAPGPGQRLRTQPPPPARWPARLPCRLHPWVRLPRPRRIQTTRASCRAEGVGAVPGRRLREPGQGSPPPRTPGWLVLGDPGLRPSPPYSQTPPLPPAQAYPHGQGQHSRYSGHLPDAVSSPFPPGRPRTWRRTGAARR